ncbi:hypothetical protein vseg_017378 [Gypsophila vaccaria]
MSLNRPTTIYLKKPMIVVPKLPNVDINRNVVMDEFNGVRPTSLRNLSRKSGQDDEITTKIYAVLEAISDRIEMHNNVKEQRVEWNALLLNSINMITLTAATMAGVSAMDEGISSNNVALKLSSMVLFVAATGLVAVMNRIQPSQLAQEQRNAVRLFKQLKERIVVKMSMTNMTDKDVEVYVEEVLALDRAYPLPLLGAMLEKFPETFKPANWWPSRGSTLSSSLDGREKFSQKSRVFGSSSNGWSEELEEEMRDIVEVIEKKDIKDYVRLGEKVLQLNKMLAISGPLLTGVAAVGSGFLAHGSGWGGVVAAVAGSLASVVSTIEHGGQVGMVFEMYRNCGGLFSRLVENVESSLEEVDYEKRENGELFEMKLALKLGRSLSEIRDLADKSRKNKGIVDEFASKLF